MGPPGGETGVACHIREVRSNWLPMCNLAGPCDTNQLERTSSIRHAKAVTMGSTFECQSSIRKIRRYGQPPWSVREKPRAVRVGLGRGLE